MIGNPSINFSLKIAVSFNDFGLKTIYKIQSLQLNVNVTMVNVIMVNVIMVNAIMVNVIMVNVIMVNVFSA